MIGLAMTMLLGMGLAGGSSGEIVCDSLHVPELITASRSRHIYVLHHQTRCYPAPDAGTEQLEKLKLSCDLFTAAYGEEEGRIRCRSLIEGLDLDP
jgi:hypothetical protein